MSGRLRTYAPMNRRSEKMAAEVSRDRTVHAHVRARSGGICEVTITAFGADGGVIRVEPRCRRLANDQHHVRKRSQGGPTTADNLIDICRDHHDRTDWPWSRGRLTIWANGDETFTSAILTKKPT